jgi:hypothetical protein
MTSDVAAPNASGIASAGREISSALCTARAMSNATPSSTCIGSACADGYGRVSVVQKEA